MVHWSPTALARAGLDRAVLDALLSAEPEVVRSTATTNTEPTPMFTDDPATVSNVVARYQRLHSQMFGQDRS